jgi:hypothetical protein
MRVHGRRQLSVRVERGGARRAVEWSWLATALLLGWACSAAVGCGKTEIPNNGPGPRRRGIGPMLTAAPVATKPEEPPSYAPVPEQPLPAADPAAAVPAPLEDPAAQPAAEAEAKPARDFAAEMTQMLGSPLSCFGARAANDAPAQLDIALSTHVMPSGTVTQSQVSAPGLAPNEIACLRSRLEALHFAGPIENAPFSVQGSLHLTREAAAAPPVPTDEARAAAAAQADNNGPAMPGPADTTTQL